MQLDLIKKQHQGGNDRFRREDALLLGYAGTHLYGYIIAILLVVLLQAYWNYEYYNKGDEKRICYEEAAE